MDTLFPHFRTNSSPIFIDCPPGSSCTVMESIRDADFCILVAGPTVFGVHNLGMVYVILNLERSIPVPK